MTTAFDGTARVWTAEGTQIEQLEPAEFVVTTAEFSDDGRQILVAGLVGASSLLTSIGYDPDHRSLVRIYDCDVCRPIDELVALASFRTIRQLTPQERVTYLGQTP